VLYITIPVVKNGSKAVSMMQAAPGPGHGLDVAFKKYVFAPKPAPTSVDGCFRILIADDVAMLRKGLVRLVVLEKFKKIPDCPISVATACTAEDALRALDSNAYDMFICDNQFAEPNDLRRLPPDRENSRFHIESNGNESAGVMRSSMMDFFKKESFTINPGDGAMSGRDTLLELAEKKNRANKFSIPVLVLHSGHQIELPRQLGIIVVRKPMKRDEFLPLFERHAEALIDSGMCVEVQKGTDTVVLSRGGAQLFVKQDPTIMASSANQIPESTKEQYHKVRKRGKSPTFSNCAQDETLVCCEKSFVEKAMFTCSGAEHFLNQDSMTSLPQNQLIVPEGAERQNHARKRQKYTEH